MMIVVDILERNARLYPGQVAISCDGRWTTHAELAERVRRLSNGVLV